MALVLVAGTIWMGRSARRDTQSAVHTVSLLYLDELAGRREQVEYGFDYKNLTEPEISIFNPGGAEKHVIIAVPVNIPFQGKTLTVCFMAMDMEEMLSAVSMTENAQGATFCNLHTKDGVALTNAVLGGLAEENNLLDAMRTAVFEQLYSYESFSQAFQSGERGVVSFDYNGIRETLAYIPVHGTDWQLTYLIRESIISDRIGAISDRTVQRSIIQSLLTIAVMLVMFGFIISQTRKNNSLRLEKETADAEMRGKQEELDRRIALQTKLEEQGQALSDALHAAEDASRAKTAFLSSMSHEIRTPMNAIIGLDNIALADPTISESTREHLEKIASSARHLLSIINDILDMSRIESGRMTVKHEEFSFADAMEQVNTIIGGQCRDKGVRYEYRIGERVEERYIGDDGKLRQILINILGNAVKFTPEGGSVAFDVAVTTRFDGRSTLRFTVTDTGIGMSREYLPKIFETFSQEDSSATNRYGSTGLGMSITRSLVELMNGTIAVESEKGVGTVFTVTVTLADAARAGGTPGPSPSSP